MGYSAFGLTGMGIAITLAYAMEMAFVIIVCRLRYGYRVSEGVMRAILLHAAIGICVYCCTLMQSRLAYCVAGAALFSIDAWLSLSVVRKHTRIMEKLKNRFIKRV